MALIVCGLLLSLTLYLVAIYGIMWSASRRIDGMESRGIRVDKKAEFPSPREILVRHSTEWLFGFFALFLLLGLINLSLWQRLGIGAIFALYFGSVWFDQSGRNTDENASPGWRSASNLWYWLLGVGDWLGFMWTLCFASALVLEAV